MSLQVVTETGATLEELFLARQDEELRRRYRQEWAQMARREAMQEASGIGDRAVIERLLALGLSAGSVAAMTLYPLVAVAWADGHMDGAEKDAILRSADSIGITARSGSRLLLECWLVEPPAAEVRNAWVEFVRALEREMEPVEFAALENETLGRARAVAEAAGGILGLMKVSEKEEAMLQSLADVFDDWSPDSE